RLLLFKNQKCIQGKVYSNPDNWIEESPDEFCYIQNRAFHRFSEEPKKSLKDGASSRERMVLTNVKNYSKLGEKFFKRI
ncbi:MAG: hypothetical protein II929_06230, partial [Succinivibrio sp.]|nr:hypothetical protein [Succinivibrio sp.]